MVVYFTSLYILKLKRILKLLLALPLPALKHSPSKKRSLVNKSKGQQPIPEQPEGGTANMKPERSGRTISFSDEAIPAGNSLLLTHSLSCLLCKK